MLTIGTRVWYAVTAPDGAIHATRGTVVTVPRRASGNYTVLSDDQEVREIGVYWYLFSNHYTRKCIHKK